MTAEGTKPTARAQPLAPADLAEAPPAIEYSGLVGAVADEETLQGPTPPLHASDRPARPIDGAAETRQLAPGSVPGQAPAEALLVDTFTSASAAPVLQASSGARPRWLGRFVVFDELGAGGMGQILAAYDPRLDRKVALKLVQRALDSDVGDWQRRLIREAQAMARLSHPNVVTVHEVATTDAGQTFLVMELVEGQDLARWLAAGPHPWREILARFLAAGEGLAAAHAAGLVHRDFKPANVLVGDDGRVRVADFGLVHGHAPSDSAGREGPRLAHLLTQHGAVMGTPAYMAPEQHDGDLTDERSDIFAFCVALWEALHGERPFAGDTMPERRAAIRRGEIREPRDPAAAPRWLRPLLRRGLAGAPGDRWPSMRMLLDALARDPELERARRRRAALRLLAVLTLGGALVYTTSILASALRERARQATAQTRLDATLDKLANLRADGHPHEADALFDAFVATPEHQGTRALVQALRWRADDRRSAGDHDDAVDHYSQAYAAAHDPRDAAEVLLGLAGLFHERRAWAPLGWVLANLRERAPELEPRARPLALDAALYRRDLATAAPLAADLSDDLAALAHARRSVQRSRRAAVIDLEGDGPRELVLWSSFSPGPRVVVTRAHADLPTVATLVAPRDLQFDQAVALPGQPARFLASAAASERGHLLVWRAGALVEETDWPAAHALEALSADLDGDARPEIYLGTGPYTRTLIGLRSDPGGWHSFTPARSVDAVHSDVMALAAGDLDGDRRPELIVGLGPWQAYDLRVLRSLAPDALTPVARRKLGVIEGLAVLPTADGPLIAVAKNPETLYAAPTMFPGGDHTGVAPGVYLFRLQGDQLEQVAFSAVEPSFRVRELFVADLTGAGPPRLLADIASTTTVERMLGLFEQGGHSLTHRRVGHLALLAVANLDDDPADELVVADTRDDDRVWTLGLGDQPLPLLDLGRPASAAPPPAALTDDPLLRDRWVHAGELAGLGLLAAAGRRFADLSRLLPPGETRGQALAQAALLAADTGDAGLAATRYEEASRSLVDPALRERAADNYVRLGRLDDAIRVLAEASIADPRRRARIDHYRDLLASERAHTFDRPLAPEWRLQSPQDLHHDPLRGVLAVDLMTPGPVLALPVDVHADPMIRVELSLAEIGWGSSFGLALRPDDPARTPLTIVVYRSGSSRDGGGQLYFRILPDDPALPIPIPRPDQRLTLEYSHLEAPDEQRLTVAVDGVQVGQLAHHGAPVSGLASLEIVRAEPPGGPGRAAPWTRLELHRLVTRGLTLRALPPDPWDATRRALVDHDGPLALAAIERALAEAAPAPDELPLWRAAAHARADLFPAAVVDLRAALGADAGPRHAAATRLLRSDSDTFAPLLREALGPRYLPLFVDTWHDTILGEPRNGPLIRALLHHMPALPADTDPQLRLDLQLARATALAHLRDNARAHHELAAVDPAVLTASAGAQSTHRRLQLRLAALDAAEGQLNHAFMHLEDTRTTGDPQLLADTLRADPDLVPLHADPRWRALAGE